MQPILHGTNHTKRTQGILCWPQGGPRPPKAIQLRKAKCGGDTFNAVAAHIGGIAPGEIPSDRRSPRAWHGERDAFGTSETRIPPWPTGEGHCNQKKDAYRSAGSRIAPSYSETVAPVAGGWGRQHNVGRTGNMSRREGPE